MITIAIMIVVIGLIAYGLFILLGVTLGAIIASILLIKERWIKRGKRKNIRK